MHYFKLHDVQKLQILHIVSNTFLIIYILVGVKEYLIVYLICISLITNDDEPHFMCLLAIYISSLEKNPFKLLANF